MGMVHTMNLLFINTAPFEMAIMLLVFIIVLALAYYVSRFIGMQNKQFHNKKNIKILETVQIAPHKHIQIIQLGKRYYAIGITKEGINLLTELDRDELDLSNDTLNTIPFKKLLAKYMNKKNEGEIDHEEKY